MLTNITLSLYQKMQELNELLQTQLRVLDDATTSLSLTVILLICVHLVTVFTILFKNWSFFSEDDGESESSYEESYETDSDLAKEDTKNRNIYFINMTYNLDDREVFTQLLEKSQDVGILDEIEEELDNLKKDIANKRKRLARINLERVNLRKMEDASSRLSNNTL